MNPLSLALPPTTAGESDAARDDARSRAEASPRASLSAAAQDEMFALLDTYFEGVSRTQFTRDLSEKDWVLRVHRADRLVGFSTLQIFHTAFEGRRLNIVYSGDTIMAPDAWGSPVLARGWISMVRRAQGASVGEPWYWLLLSSGFRTFRFLPVFCREFWPRHDAPTPPTTTRLMAQLARERFGRAFEETAGVVRFAAPQRLRGELAVVPDGKRRDEHVEFFLARNPGHAAGDQLVCLAALGDENFTAAGARMVRGSAPASPP